jgi:hypothetical protein
MQTLGNAISTLTSLTSPFIGFGFCFFGAPPISSILAPNRLPPEHPWQSTFCANPPGLSRSLTTKK